jgi:hypothetical protein
MYPSRIAFLTGKTLASMPFPGIKNTVDGTDVQIKRLARLSGWLIQVRNVNAFTTKNVRINLVANFSRDSEQRRVQIAATLRCLEEREKKKGVYLMKDSEGERKKRKREKNILLFSS